MDLEDGPNGKRFEICVSLLLMRRLAEATVLVYTLTPFSYGSPVLDIVASLGGASTQD